MPFPDHYLLQWGGDFASEPNEIWSNTIRFATGGGDDDAGTPSMPGQAQDTAAAACLGVLQAAFVANDCPNSSNTRIKYAKFNRIDDQGHFADSGATHAAFADGAGTPGQKSGPHPVTAALVVTWRTAASRGRASRGRIFVPQPVTPTANPTYRFTPADCTALAGHYRTLLMDLEDAVVAAGGTGLKPCVVSQLGATGHSLAIVRAEIGNFIDYMGSRRNNLTEVRTQSAALA